MAFGEATAGCFAKAVLSADLTLAPLPGSGVVTALADEDEDARALDG